jgi:uncharacterized protein (DUF2267 family)
MKGVEARAVHLVTRRRPGARMARLGVFTTLRQRSPPLCSVLKAAQLPMASAHKIHDTCQSQAATHTYSFGDVWHCVQQSNCSSCISVFYE